MKPSACATCRALPTRSGLSATGLTAKNGYVSLEVNLDRGTNHLRRIGEEAQIIVSDALAASSQQPGIPAKTNLKEEP